MDFFLYLFASAGFLILSLCFFTAALFCSYKYASWKGLLSCFGLGALSPVSLLILTFCVWLSVFFMDKPYFGETAAAAVLIVWIICSLLPFGVIIKNGIKNHRKIQIWSGIYGTAATISFITSVFCFVKFGCNAT